MSNYSNDFENAIMNVPYSTDWFEMRCSVVQIILDEYYDRMTMFQMFQDTPTDEPNRHRSMVFEIYGELYMWNESIENGLIESGQLDKILHLDSDWMNCIAVTLYSNVANAEPAAPIALRYYKSTGKLFVINPQLSKR